MTYSSCVKVRKHSVNVKVVHNLIYVIKLRITLYKQQLSSVVDTSDGARGPR